MEQIRYLIIILVAIVTVAFAATELKEKLLVVPIDHKIFKVDYAKEVNFDLFGASQVTIILQNLNVSRPVSDVIRVALNPRQLGINYWDYDTKARIKVNPGTIPYLEVKGMVNIPYGTSRLFIKLPEPLQVSNINKIFFTLKQLDPLNSYSISPDSNKELALTDKAPSKPGGIIGDPVLFTNKCDDRQKFRFQENNINNRYTIGIERPSYRAYLQLKELSSKIGSPVTAYEMNSRTDSWYLIPSTIGGSFKIKSGLSGTCMSAVNGFGGKIVMDDCENGNDLSWKITFCND